MVKSLSTEKVNSNVNADLWIFRAILFDRKHKLHRSCAMTNDRIPLVQTVEY